MSGKSLQFSFGDERRANGAFTLHEYIIEDRGSRYSVSIGEVHNREDIKTFLATLKKSKRYAAADHNSYAARISNDGAIYETKHDDGEAGAGMVILRIMQKEAIVDTIICVTRWFGGIKLMGDRFRHIQNATKHAVDSL